MEVSLTVNMIVVLFFKIAVYCIPEVMPATFHLLVLSSIFFKLLKTEKLETCRCLLFNVIFPLFCCLSFSCSSRLGGSLFCNSEPQRRQKTK